MRLLPLLLSALAGVVCDARSLAAEPPRPNVVLCMADDQGWGDMAYNGHPTLHTPTFDEMARTGLRLDRFYAAAPVCSPTRGSVLTGRTPNRYGVFSWGHSLRPQELTLAEVLRKAGYATGHFGKWHLGSVLPDAPTSPGANGFETWVSAPNFFELDPWLSRQGRAEQLRGESSELVVAEALRFIRESAAGNRPFLAVVWFGSPHAPHVGTQADLARYADQPPAQRNFLAEITAMDRAMGQLRAGLRELGVARDTLLWYCSDNGAIPQGSTGGLRGRKGTLYEGGLRVPGLIEWPARITAPRQSEFPAGTVDIFPTVLDLAGADREASMPLDGQSLVPLLSGDPPRRNRPLGFWDAGVKGFGTPSDRILSAVAEQQRAGEPITVEAAHGLPPADFAWPAAEGSYPGHAAWLDGPWKLHRIEHPRTGEVRCELYHLPDDPTESQDRAATDPDETAALRAALERWLTSVTGSLRGQDYR